MEKYQRPEVSEVPFIDYKITRHLVERYKKRLTKTASNYLSAAILGATPQEIERRANFMLLFSSFEKAGKEPNTEIRNYYGWRIVIDLKSKKIITIYQTQRKMKSDIPSSCRRKLYRAWFNTKEDAQ